MMISSIVVGVGGAQLLATTSHGDILLLAGDGHVLGTINNNCATQFSNHKPRLSYWIMDFWIMCTQKKEEKNICLWP